MREVWKVVPDWPNYEVSNLGRVRRGGLDSVGRYWPVNMLKVKPGGYVRLVNKPKRYDVSPGRLVLLAFVGPPPRDKPNACHRDDNRFNNHLKNMYWGSAYDNVQDRDRNGHHPTVGKPRSALTRWRIGFAQRGKIIPPEVREKISLAKRRTGTRKVETPQQ